MDALKRDREAKQIEQILKKILLELEDKGCKITLKDKQRKAVKQLYGERDLVAVLPTGFKKSHLPAAGANKIDASCLCLSHGSIKLLLL